MCKSEIYIRSDIKENYNNLLKYSKTKSCIVLKYPEFWINLVLPQTSSLRKNLLENLTNIKMQDVNNQSN